MHFRHISAKIQLKNLKQHFDWGGGPLGYALEFGHDLIVTLCILPKCLVHEIVIKPSKKFKSSKKY